MDWEKDPELIAMRLEYTASLNELANKLNLLPPDLENEKWITIVHKLAGTLGSYGFYSVGRGFIMLDDLAAYRRVGDPQARQKGDPSLSQAALSDIGSAAVGVLQELGSGNFDCRWPQPEIDAITSAFESLPAEAKSEPS